MNCTHIFGDCDRCTEIVDKLARIAYENTVSAMNYCEGYGWGIKRELDSYKKDLKYIEEFLRD